MNTSGFFSVHFIKKKSFLEFVRQCFFLSLLILLLFCGWFLRNAANDTHHEVDNVRFGCWPNIVWWISFYWVAMGQLRRSRTEIDTCGSAIFARVKIFFKKNNNQIILGYFRFLCFGFILSSWHLMCINGKSEDWQIKMTHTNSISIAIKNPFVKSDKERLFATSLSSHHCFGPSTRNERVTSGAVFFFVTAIAIAVVPNILLSEKNTNSQLSVTHQIKKKKLFKLIVMVSPSSSSPIHMAGYRVCRGDGPQQHQIQEIKVANWKFKSSATNSTL